MKAVLALAALPLLLPLVAADPVGGGGYVNVCTDQVPGNCGGLVCYWGDTWAGQCVIDPCGGPVSECSVPCACIPAEQPQAHPQCYQIYKDIMVAGVEVIMYDSCHVEVRQYILG